MKNSVSQSPDFHPETQTFENASEPTFILVGDAKGGDWLASAAADQLWDLVRYDGHDEVLDAVRAGEVDCIINSSSASANSDANFLAAVRSIESSVPFLLWTSDPDAGLLRDVLSEPNTTFVPQAAGAVSDGVLLNQITQL